MKPLKENILGKKTDISGAIIEDEIRKQQQDNPEFKVVSVKGNTITIIPKLGKWISLYGEELKILKTQFGIDTIRCEKEATLDIEQDDFSYIKNFQLVHPKSILYLNSNKKVEIKNKNIICGGLSLGEPTELVVQNCRIQIIGKPESYKKQVRTGVGSVEMSANTNKLIWSNNKIEGNPVLVWLDYADQFANKLKEIDIDWDCDVLESGDTWTYDDNLPANLGLPEGFNSMIWKDYACRTGLFWVTQKAKNRWVLQYYFP